MKKETEVFFVLVYRWGEPGEKWCGKYQDILEAVDAMPVDPNNYDDVRNYMILEVEDNIIIDYIGGRY